MLRVGRCLCAPKGRVDPQFPGFRVIVVLTKGSSVWGEVGPYELRDEEGRIMENVWQFSKVYPAVEATTQRKSRFHPEVVWDHGAEEHLLAEGAGARLDNLAPAYWAWRAKGMAAPHAVRYPPGFGKMDRCIGAFVEDGPGRYRGPLGYVEARRALYVPLYCRLAKAHPRFLALRRLLDRGVNLLIVEVDGPHQESLEHYQRVYGVGPDFIEGGSVAATLENLSILLDDPLHPFGHGYCLAAALLGIDGDLLTPAAGVPPGTPFGEPEGPPEPIADDDALWAELGL